MRVEMEVVLLNAISTEISRNPPISTRMMVTSFLSVMDFFIAGLIMSIVKVELEVNTREDRVDMDAESTRTTTRPISRSGSAVYSTAGIITSNSGLPLERVAINVLPLVSAASVVQNKRSKPPSR